MKNTSGFLLRLLVDPRYRICRHFLLFVLSVIILSVNFYVDVIEDSRILVSNVIQSALPYLFERICTHTPFIAEK